MVEVNTLYPHPHMHSLYAITSITADPREKKNRKVRVNIKGMNLVRSDELQPEAEVEMEEPEEEEVEEVKREEDEDDMELLYLYSQRVIS